VSKPITSQELDQSFRELLQLRVQVRKAELEVKEAAERGLKNSTKLDLRQTAASVVLH
jgi:hypothetical protein